MYTSAARRRARETLVCLQWHHVSQDEKVAAGIGGILIEEKAKSEGWPMTMGSRSVVVAASGGARGTEHQLSNKVRPCMGGVRSTVGANAGPQGRSTPCFPMGGSSAHVLSILVQQQARCWPRKQMARHAHRGRIGLPRGGRGEGPGANIERIGNMVEGNGARASAASLRMMAFVDVGKLVLVLVVNSGS